MKLIFFLITLFSVTKSFACLDGQYQVKAHPRSGYIRYDGVAVEATFVTAYCKDYSAAYLFVKDLFKDKAPKDWPHKEISKAWTESERERVIEALENVPEILRVKGVEGIYRMLKSKNFPNPSTSAPEVGYIVLYNSAFDLRVYKDNLDRVLNHELSHLFFENLSKSDKLDYGQAAGWTKAPERDFLTPRNTGYVEKDGRVSVDEDFANNIEYYLYEPDKLKEVNPKIYAWINKKFGTQLSLLRKKKK